MRFTIKPIVTLATLWLGTSSLFSAERVEINLAHIEKLAQDLAAKPYSEPRKVPALLQQLSYDQYRDIRFNTNRAFWREQELPFHLEFFHPGYLFTSPVRIREFTDTHAQEIRFVPDFFDYGQNVELGKKIPASLGYAGFRIHHPINDPKQFDEIAVFLGASYFRVLGRGHTYGISARGLALNTGLTDAVEEFPVFRDFWVGKPADDAKNIIVYALLDSRSVSGAYRFDIRPGEKTVVDVEAVLYFRNEVERIGLAPFSSMFFFGENTLETQKDYRPEVHDSDGLLIETSAGEKIWRPLVNEIRTRHSAFTFDETPVGFGLRQRDRNFENYQDIEARYHLRPSVWVKPVGNWGAGTLRLIEFHNRDELMDNVVAFWEPQSPPQVGQAYPIAYSISWESSQDKSLGYVHATRAGINLNDNELYEFVIDFAGDNLSKLAAVDVPETQVEVSEDSELINTTIIKNPFNDTWRVVLYVKPRTPTGATEMSVKLVNDGHTLSETWSYQWIR